MKISRISRLFLLCATCLALPGMDGANGQVAGVTPPTLLLPEIDGSIVGNGVADDKAAWFEEDFEPQRLQQRHKPGRKTRGGENSFGLGGFPPFRGTAGQRGLPSGGRR